MKKIEKLRQEYENLQTPQDLDSFMESCIEHAQKKQKRFSFQGMWKPALSAALIGYLIMLNTVPAFAQSVFDIPLLGDVSRILCVREYKKTSDVDSLSVKVPEVKNTGNPEMEDRVNQQIEERINKTTEQLYKDSAQVREMMKKEKVESLTAKTEVTIDYKITCNQNDLLSFQIMTNYQLNTSMQEYQTFNLDLASGKDITLQDLFGADYEKIINASVRKQIKQRTEQDETASYFDGAMGFQGIRKNQPFYIDDKGNVVIIFEKYSIAPGYMGTQEFQIPCSELHKYTGGK
ncbi:DUF3298 and DUF4163 domain-containing protein [[Clostridium] innocuum]|nr:DUF3298 and DUF4163 domain-containing protein [[Clostridium] innocuum]MCR0576948.1 DUF3298 and DUF4163 domain-containing protein [[Clostridium] innocuum]